MRELLPPGIPDEAFVRGAVPMTKAEPRAITMAKARLHPSASVLDIGAGTGSLTVEAALLCPEGEVVAVERSVEALELLRANLDRFGVADRVRVVAGEAPEALAGLGEFDAVLVGGSGSRLTELLAALPSLLVPGGRAVTNTIGLQSTAEIVDAFRLGPWAEWECVQVNVARAAMLGEVVRFEPLNPMWVSAATLKEDE